MTCNVNEPRIDPSAYDRSFTLRDGTPVRLRAIRPSDKQQLADGFRRLSGKSVYFRFFGNKSGLSDQELKFYTEIDYVDHVALVAALAREDGELLVGVGRYVAVETSGPLKQAEVAFAVDDAHQNMGIGTLLFEQILTLAAENGIRRIQADILGHNKNMLEIFQLSGFDLKSTCQSGTMHIEFDLAIERLNRHYPA